MIKENWSAILGQPGEGDSDRHDPDNGKERDRSGSPRLHRLSDYGYRKSHGCRCRRTDR